MLVDIGAIETIALVLAAVFIIIESLVRARSQSARKPTVPIALVRKHLLRNRFFLISGRPLRHKLRVNQLLRSRQVILLIHRRAHNDTIIVHIDRSVSTLVVSLQSGTHLPPLFALGADGGHNGTEHHCKEGYQHPKEEAKMFLAVTLTPWAVDVANGA